MLYLSAAYSNPDISVRPIIIMRLIWPSLTQSGNDQVSRLCDQFFSGVVAMIEDEHKSRNNIEVILKFINSHFQLESDRNQVYLSQANANGVLKKLAFLYSNFMHLSTECIVTLDLILTDLIENYSTFLGEQLTYFEDIQTWDTLLNCWVHKSQGTSLVTRLRIITCVQELLRRSNYRLPWCLANYILRTLEDRVRLSEGETCLLCIILGIWINDRCENKEKPSYEETDLLRRLKHIGDYGDDCSQTGLMIDRLEAELKDRWGIEC